MCCFVPTHTSLQEHATALCDGFSCSFFCICIDTQTIYEKVEILFLLLPNTWCTMSLFWSCFLVISVLFWEFNFLNLFQLLLILILSSGFAAFSYINCSSSAFITMLSLSLVFLPVMHHVFLPTLSFFSFLLTVCSLLMFLSSFSMLLGIFRASL